MIKQSRGRWALRGERSQQLAAEVSKVNVMGKDVFPKSPLLADVALRGGRGGPLGPSEPPLLLLGLQVLLLHRRRRVVEHRGGERPERLLHEGQVLQVLVRREEELPRVELHQD